MVLRLSTLLFFCSNLIFAQSLFSLTHDTNGNRLSKKFQGSSTNLLIVANPLSIQLNQSSTLVASGCSGTVKWSTNQQGTSIIVQPTKTTQYKAECIIPNCSVNGIGLVTVEVYQCQSDAIGITANVYSVKLGQPVTLTAYGCPGKITWSNGQTGFNTTTQIYSNTNTFSASCSKRNCPNSGIGNITITGISGCQSGDILVTTQKGNWTSPSTWSCNRIPTINDEVLLNHEVIVNENGFSKGIIIGNGFLNYISSSYITLPQN